MAKYRVREVTELRTGKTVYHGEYRVWKGLIPEWAALDTTTDKATAMQWLEAMQNPKIYERPE